VIYSLSVLLIILLFSSFLMPEKSADKSVTATTTGTNQRASVIELLHRRMTPLQLASISFVENGASADGLKEVEKQKALFIEVVDSLRKQTADIDVASEKAEIENLLKNFALDAERELRFATSLSLAGQNQAAPTDTAVRAELDRLKTLLVQKDETIAELEKQKQIPAAGASDAEAIAWKERYNKLKASTDRSSSQLNDLKNSYKEVVEDNRRLIAQLQAARAGKN
jgi:hypothetical protein